MDKRIPVILISLILVVTLLSQINLKDLINVLLRADLRYLAPGFFVMMGAYFFRGLRFYYMLDRRISLKNLVQISCVLTFINVLVPARIGEVSYIYMIKKFGSNTGAGIGTLVVARSLDLIFISSFFIIAILNLGNVPPIVSRVLYLAAAAMLGVILFLAGFLYHGEKLKSIAFRAAKRLKFHGRIIDYLFRKADETIAGMVIMKSRKVATYSIITSGGIWMLLVSSTYLFVHAFGIDLGVVEIVIITSLVSLLPILPFYGFGGFGTTEAAFALLFISFEVEKEHAIAASFGVHIVPLAFIALLGMIGMNILKLELPDRIPR